MTATKKKSLYPQGYYPNGEWAGFFYDEEAVRAWCKLEKGRRFDYEPRPIIERAKQAVKRKVKKFSPVPATKGHKSAPTTKRVVVTKAQKIEWDVDDIKDDAKMEEVAQKSQEAAIEKLTTKKTVKKRGKK